MDRVTLFNQALGNLGAELISDPDSGEKNAEYCRLYYENSRKKLLRDYWWNFATKRQALALSATDPTFGYEYAYVLPTDCLFLRSLTNITQSWVEDESWVGVTYDWVIEGNRILTDMQEAYAIYSYDVSIDQCPPDFTDTLGYLLSAKIVPKIKSQDLDKQSQMWNAFQSALAYALNNGAAERRKAINVPNPFVSERRK